MTPLEQKIYTELIKCVTIARPDSIGVREWVCMAYAEIAAKIALDLAYDAYMQGSSDCNEYLHGGSNKTFNQFIQDYE